MTRCRRSRCSRRRRASPISLVIDELRAIISSVADASQFLMVVTDADGIILWREGAARVRSRRRRARLRRGSRVDRGAGRHQRDRHGAGRGEPGAAVLGRALRGRPAPVVLHRRADPRPPHRRPARHRRRQRPGDDAAPGDRRAGRDRRPAGRVAAVAAPRAAARTAARTAAAPVLASVAGPLLLVDDHGWVAHTVGHRGAGPDRGAARRAAADGPGPRPVPARADRGRLAGPARRARDPDPDDAGPDRRAGRGGARGAALAQRADRPARPDPAAAPRRRSGRD